MTSSSAHPIGRAGTSHPATIRAARSVVRKERAMPSSPPDDARRIFSGIGATYERAGALLSFGQDARWRARLVDSVRAAPGDVVLDVATGTGLVARAVSERYGCEVVGLDPSGDMLSAAVARNGHIPLVRARAESLPFPDESFDHLTFSYLLRYVDDPAATMTELARVVRPGGTMGFLEFFVPPNPTWRAAWLAYTRLLMPVIGRLTSKEWYSAGRFLGPSITGFYRSYPLAVQREWWQVAGMERVRYRVMSLGGGEVSWWLLAFVAFGAFVVVAYNLELFGSRLHSDAWFAAAWGAFPAITAYYAQAETIEVAGVLVAIACLLVSAAQRTLSTPVRRL